MDSVEFCPQCKKPVHGTPDFCPHCGAPLTTQAKRLVQEQEQQEKNWSIPFSEGDEVRHPDRIMLLLSILSLFVSPSLFLALISLFLSKPAKAKSRSAKSAYYISIVSLTIGIVFDVIVSFLMIFKIIKVR